MGHTIIKPKRVVLSLYDYTGEAVKPWAEAGYECICVDIQHPLGGRYVVFDGGGSIHFIPVDLHDPKELLKLVYTFEGEVAFGMAFPVCTDLAVSGAAHFANKSKADPDFQAKAANYAEWCADAFELLGCPYFVENPVSRLATLWRKPNHSFHPYEYGGYIPDGQGLHPTWPDYISPFDAYPKKTCLWTGGGFKMPTKAPVEVVPGYSTQHKKLGGKSTKTKNIRSATPRGFARAVFEANKGI